MPKIAVAVIALIAVALFHVLAKDHDKTGKVRSCLEHAGASVTPSTMFEDILSSGAAAQGEEMAGPMLNIARDVDSRLLNVRFGADDALVIVAKNGGEADKFGDFFASLGTIGALQTLPARRTGNVLVLWSQPPQTVAASSLDGCID
jgi:hypothetical protein